MPRTERAFTSVRNNDPMIDYFALALGHGLMAIALLRLVWRDGLDKDPLIGEVKDAIAQKRKDASIAGRNARRREAAHGDEQAS
ncbi:MAG: hypothetical protein AAGE86_01640 [Pseudomonadota bacterium]